MLCFAVTKVDVVDSAIGAQMEAASLEDEPKQDASGQIDGVPVEQGTLHLEPPEAILAMSVSTPDCPSS